MPNAEKRASGHPEGSDSCNLKKAKVDRYQDSWKRRWPWLRSESDAAGMFCDLCSEFYSSHDMVFVSKGCRDFKTSALLRHANSKKHQAALSMQSLARTANIRRAVQHVLNADEQSVVASMKTAYFIAVQDLPLSKHSSLLSLLKNLECPAVSGSKFNYSHSESISEFQEIMASIIEEDLLSKVQDSRFISIIIDESTDVSVQKRLILYIKLLNGASAETHFVRNVEVVNGTAETITSKLQEIMESLGIPWKKVVCLSSDGASVMVGRLTGVATRLKEFNPAMMNIHCAGHRLSLAVSQATHGIPYLTKFETNIKSLFNFFHYSAVRYNHLREVQNLLNEPVVKIPEWHSVRWLSLQKAVATIVKTFGPLLTTLGHESTHPAAIGMCTFMSSPKFILTCGFFLDVLQLVEPLNRVFQQQASTYSSITPLVTSTVKNLKDLEVFPGDNEKMVRSKIDQHGTYGEIPMVISDAMKTEFGNLKGKYLQNLVENLERRFPSKDTGLLAKLSVLNPNNWPKEAEKLREYGQEELLALLTHYQEYMEGDHDDLLSEWRQFLRFVFDNHQKHMTSFSELSQLTLNHLKTPFPSVAVLFELAQVLAVSSADCERGFSIQNIIKTHKRSCLKSSTLQNLQMIKVEGPSIEEFDFVRALTKWRARKARKI